MQGLGSKIYNGFSRVCRPFRSCVFSTFLLAHLRCRVPAASAQNPARPPVCPNERVKSIGVNFVSRCRIEASMGRACCGPELVRAARVMFPVCGSSNPDGAGLRESANNCYCLKVR